MMARNPILRSWSYAVSILLLAFGSLSVQARDSQDVQDHWGGHLLGINSCVRTLENSGNDLSSAADCVAEQMFSSMSDLALQFIDRYGKTYFGQHFQVDHRLSLSASTGTLSADLDVVIPLNSFGSVPGDTVTQSFFVQQGLTRWRDGNGFQRNDVRFGVVHRFELNELPGPGVLGASAFFQENLERGHARLTTGLEYFGRWGKGSLSYYSPMTDWKPGRFGYEERALAGMEFDIGSDLTRTINFNAAVGRWENKDGSGEWLNRGRLGIRWQPHPWFALQGSWDGIGTADDAQGLHAVVTIPFGGSEWSRVRWRGLGLGVGDPEDPDPGAMWSPVTNVGRIEVAEREVSSPDPEDDSSDSELLMPDMSGQGPVSSETSS